tara:strand:- start:1048 stop:1821 length:774 start_codon:yes stop_codon:yes gene_type:complete
MIKLATPISHLFENSDYKKIIIDNSDEFECRDRSIDSTIDNQTLFHCELQPIHQWGKEEWSFLKKIKNSKPDLRLITFHLASCCDAPILSENMFKLGGREYSQDEMFDIARSNFSEIKVLFGSDVSIAVENNNYYPTEAYRDVTEASFISKIVYDNDLKFLFDLSHARVTCFNKNVNFDRYKNDLPLDRTIQLHICTFGIDKEKELAYDAHNFPDDEELLEIQGLIKEYKSIEYLTVEYYRDIENLEASLKRVRELV